VKGPQKERVAYRCWCRKTRDSILKRQALPRATTQTDVPWFLPCDLGGNPTKKISGCSSLLTGISADAINFGFYQARKYLASN
jgi:hypothetical protein